MSAENVIVDAADRPVVRPAGSNRMTRIAGNPLQPETSAATCHVRIHRDGLLVARCSATGVAPGRLFVSIDPLHYPVNSQLDLEFERDGTCRGQGTLQGATVTARNIHGIELLLEPAAA